jgi:hypothetical protein
VTSLHYHFPWLIKANIRWSVYAAATGRRMKPMGWERFFNAVDDDMTLRERLDSLLHLVHERYETERFEAFCHRHLAHLNEVAYEFFGTEVAHDAVRQKVAALFPEHEVEEFTELMWSRIQAWRDAEGEPST